MDEMEILKLLISNGSVTAALLGLAIIFRPILLGWQRGGQEARKLEAGRLESERRQAQELTEALSGVKNQLKTGTDVTDRLIGTLGNMSTREDMQQAGKTMREWATGHELALQHAHNDVRTVPAEVWRIGDPKLSDVRTAIEIIIGQMEQRIIGQMDPTASAARAAVQQEFAGLLTRLESIEQALLRLQPPVPETAGVIAIAPQEALQNE